MGDLLADLKSLVESTDKEFTSKLRRFIDTYKGGSTKAMADYTSYSESSIRSFLAGSPCSDRFRKRLSIILDEKGAAWVELSSSYSGPKFFRANDLFWRYQ